MMNDLNQVRGASREKVEAMFDSISHRYDLLNRLLSLGTDKRWRRKAINIIGEHIKASSILDVATGTADLAIEALMLKPDQITGIDISEKMLAAGQEKLERHGYSEKIRLIKGDSEKILFPDNMFDAVMSAFGVRNFENTVTGLGEMLRVIRPGGMIMVLEFSRPGWFPLRQIYGFYFRKILPWIGRKVSGDPDAYSYLPDSVMSFPDNENFLALLRNVGFAGAEQCRLSGGIASIYYGFKP
ncbi:MAG: bifunctional demethylmenaquinone methyltransferase/2-methoxy-6-polyprenyl-1,4-benzoquinol methylase UbiE [Bacteroidales bacterium]|jgi:demethylmenaquinone methyltransferase/2-methoxy-6-polyprenyl-1,4-benzoquinol methylase|nr:bifunctional demethylmenaquinone methyltransferase/2-methoxy-6-polyprenyl-1,4-benzoquinol methylase UbiE [Bacteroidales bacterium]